MELTREGVLKGLAGVGYVADPQLAMAITLMRRLQRPLLLEGEAGVGKIEVGEALACMLGRPLIRLQGASLLDFFLPTAVEPPVWETDFTTTTA